MSTKLTPEEKIRAKVQAAHTELMEIAARQEPGRAIVRAFYLANPPPPPPPPVDGDAMVMRSPRAHDGRHVAAWMIAQLRDWKSAEPTVSMSELSRRSGLATSTIKRYLV